MQPPWCGLQSWHCGSYRRAKRENWILNGSYVEDSKKWLINSYSVFNYFFAALGFVWDNVLEVSFNGICVTRAVHAGNAVVCAASTLFFQLLLHLSVALLSCVIGMLLFFFSLSMRLLNIFTKADTIIFIYVSVTLEIPATCAAE